MLPLLGAAAALALQAPAQAPCHTRLCYPESLRPFLDKLRAGGWVHIIQIGDSHTAGDMITNGWRTRLQARYGFGGRGVLAAGGAPPRAPPPGGGAAPSGGGGGEGDVRGGAWGGGGAGGRPPVPPRGAGAG